MNIPQYVPQKICLSCDGCCRFKDAESSWRPKIAMDDVYSLRLQKPELAELVFSKDSVDKNSYLRTKPACESCSCHFFNDANNTCNIYDDRPFECAFYPFLLRKVDEKFFVSVHVACPHILDTRDDKKFEAHLLVLKDYVLQEKVLKYLSRNKNLFAAYNDYDQEIDECFEISMPSDTKENVLLNKRFTFDYHKLNKSFQESPFAFNAVFSWQHFYDFEFKVIDNCLCIFANQKDGRFLYVPPLGNFSPKVIEQCFTLMKEFPTARIDNVSQSLLNNFPEEKYERYQKGYEYCYFKKDLVELKGNVYKSKRSTLNHFMKHYPNHEYTDYTDEMFDDCMALYQKWKGNRKKSNTEDVYQHLLDENYQVHRDVLKYFTALGLVGRVVYVEGRLSAYTFGYPVSKNVFCILFEITDLDIKGLSIFIFSQFCKDAMLEQYSFINVMDDSTLGSLKIVKESFHPSVMLPLYTIVERV